MNSVGNVENEQSKVFNLYVPLVSVGRAIAIVWLPLSIVCLPSLPRTVDVRQFGAKGDGVSKDTKAIQAAIDSIESTGGTVVVSAGRYLCGTVHLRSNLTVRLEQGAILVFSPEDDDFDAYEKLPYHLNAPPKKEESQVTFVNRLPAERRRLSAPPAWDDTETTYFHYALLSGDAIQNVSIEGPGEIDGNRPRRGGPKPIAFKNSEWITIRGITIRNAPNYNISFLATDHVEVEGVRLLNGYADGIDPDGCHFVRITNSYVDAWDDAICPKSSMALGKPRTTENLVVSNCILRTSCNNFKFGTETAGGLKNVTVGNCVMLRRESGRRPLGGIAIESVDGANVDGVVISGVSMQDVVAPIFIRLGNRGRGMETPAPGSIQNVSIRNVMARGASLASSITGIETASVRNVTIDGLDVTAMGGIAARDMEVAEAPAKYPDPDMFGDLPALALYGRHAEGLTIRGLRVHAMQPDGRPAVVLDVVQGLELSGFTSTNIPPHRPLLLFRNVDGAFLRGNVVASSADVFLQLDGAQTARVVLRGNDLHLARQVVQRSGDVREQAVSLGTGSGSDQ